MTTDCLAHQVRESTGREDGAEATKIGEVPKDTSVRIMETIVLSDGTEKALISKDGVVASAYGWIVTKIPGKAKGEEDQNLLVPATPLPISFDLAVHTANSLMRVLSGKAGKARALSNVARTAKASQAPWRASVPSLVIRTARPPRGTPSSPSLRPSRWSSTASMRPSLSPAGLVSNTYSRSFHSK